MKPSDAPCVAESKRERLQTPNRTSSVGADPTAAEVAAKPRHIRRGAAESKGVRNGVRNSGSTLRVTAAEKAAKSELKMAKLKMEMATAKLAYVRATEAYKAAKSGQDIAEQEQKEDKENWTAKLNSLQTPRRTRPPSYRKRLERREKERVEGDSEKTAQQLGEGCNASAEKHEDRLPKADVAVVKLVAAPQAVGRC